MISVNISGSKDTNVNIKDGNSSIHIDKKSNDNSNTTVTVIDGKIYVNGRLISIPEEKKK